jgi:hypothetical protein
MREPETPDTEVDGEVMGVTEPSYFTRASQLIQCEWCGETGLLPSDVYAVKPHTHTVMMCSNCVPEQREWE